MNNSHWSQNNSFLFLKAGQTARSKSTDGSKAALVKYNIFAWITPAVIVTTSVILDKTDTLFIGYGKQKPSVEKTISMHAHKECRCGLRLNWNRIGCISMSLKSPLPIVFDFLSLAY